MSIGAITSATLPSLSAAGKASAGLDAQLAQYQIQLADWTNCPSCNTPEGKAKIQELTSKVSETQASIRAAEVSSQGDGASLRVVAPAPAAVAVTGSIGSILNDYA